MARSRILRPGFFISEELGRHSFAHRLAFAGLWILADRDGRLEDRPARIRAELFPYDSSEAPCPYCHGRGGVDIEAILADLHDGNLITRYLAHTRASSATIPAISIGTFTRHQKPHSRESPSDLEPPPAIRENVPENEKPRQGDAEDIPNRGQAAPRRSCTTSTSTSVPPTPTSKAHLGSAYNGRGGGGEGGGGVNARSKHPVFKGARIVVFDWMLEELVRILGSYAEGFDLHAWFYQLDSESAALVLPADRNERWAWLQQAIVLEAQRRGLPIASAASHEDATWAAIVREGPGR